MTSPLFTYSSKFDFLTYRHLQTRSKTLTNFDSHAHNGCEILYIVEGFPEYGFEEQTVRLKPGDVIIMPPEHYHFCQVPPNEVYERINLIIYPKALNAEVTLNKAVLLSNENKTLQRIIKDLTFYQENCETERLKEIFEIKTRELIFIINHLLPNNDALLNSTVNETLKNILNYINANLKKNITVSDIAEHCFLSEGHVFHLFSEKLKTSPMHYVKTKKMLLAQSLISSENSKQAIHSIATDLGFEDYSVFYRNYLKFFNHKPSDDLHKN